MSFFHCVNAFTSFGSIPVPDSMFHIPMWWIEKKEAVIQGLAAAPSLLCELLQNSSDITDFSLFGMTMKHAKAFFYLLLTACGSTHSQVLHASVRCWEAARSNYSVKHGVLEVFECSERDNWYTAIRLYQTERLILSFFDGIHYVLHVVLTSVDIFKIIKHQINQEYEQYSLSGW